MARITGDTTTGSATGMAAAANATAMDIDHETTTTSMTTSPATSTSISREIQALQDDHYLDHLTEEPLRTLALEATLSSSSTTTEPTVRVEVLEIGLRNEMLKRLQSIMTPTTTASCKTPVVDVPSTVGDFWKSALCLCWHLVFMAEKEVHSPADTNDADNTSEAAASTKRRYNFDGLSLVRKIPFILLEDVLDSLPSLQHCGQFWKDTVQPSFALLFHPQVMWTPSSSKNNASHPCWLPFLKISNKYIRRAAHHPSSSSSSNSHTNMNNVGAMTACTVMSTLCSVFPLAEKSATRPWGSHNADHMTSFESLQEFETNNIPAAAISTATTTPSATAAVVDTEDDGAVPDYSFYESFWKLQEDFSNPNAIKVAEFMQRLKTVITAMESTTPPPPTTTTSSTATTTTSTTEAMSLLYQPKYLTSSRLLSIQLSHDLDFRRHILCQVLVVIHHLSTNVPVLKPKLEDAQQRAIRLLLLSSKNSSSTDNHQQQPKIVDFLQSLFNTSELQWRNWKKSKCVQDLDQRQSQPLKRKAAATTVSTATTVATAGRVHAGARKRKRLDSPSENLSDDDDDVSHVDDDDDDLDMTQTIRVHGGGDHLLQSISRRMRGIQPSIQDHLNDYVEALDPDAGIEAEYHPKTNALFCWRAVRLLLSCSSSSTNDTNDTNGNVSATSHLQDFAQISPSGDFEALVREMYKRKGVHIPGEAPIYQRDGEFDEQKEAKEDEGAKESEQNSPTAEEDNDEEEDDKDTGIKMEEDVVDDMMDADGNGEDGQGKKPPPSNDESESEPVSTRGVVKEEHNRHVDGEPSETGEMDSSQPIKAEASNISNGKGGQRKDIVDAAPITAPGPVTNGAPPPLREQKGTGGGGNSGGTTGRDARPGKEAVTAAQHSRSPGKEEEHSNAAIKNPPHRDNRGSGGGGGGGGGGGVAATRGRLSPVPQQQELAGRRNRSENDLSRRGVAAAAGPLLGHASPPPTVRGGAGGALPDRRVDHGAPDRRHDGPPPGQRRSGGGGGGGPHVDRGGGGGPHIDDRDEHRRGGGGGGGGGGGRGLSSNSGPREDRREDRRTEERRGAAADDRRGSGGEDRNRGGEDRNRGGGGAGDDRRGAGGGGDDRRGAGGGGDDRTRGGDWRPRGSGGGGRDQSRGRHSRR